MTSTPVSYAASHGLASLTLDSPRNRNALSRAVVEGLILGLDRAEADDAVRVVLVRAEGRVFCSGADLAEAASEGMEVGSRRMVELQRRIVASPKPVVVRVQGAVRAGGLGLVAAADLAVAVDEAAFALTEVRLGLAPAAISLTVLPRLTSRAAARVFLTGETFDARAAAAMGLVTVAVPAEDLDAEVEQLLDALLRGHPQGLRECKRLAAADLLDRIERDGAAMAARSAELFGSLPAREAMRAFLAGRR